MELINRLEQLDCSKIKKFSFDGIKTYARVVKIYDPDTITIIFEWINQMIKLNIRLDGIDAPELKSKIKSESDACKKGINKLNELINDKIIYVIFGKYDKYGRILARINTLEPIENELYCINDYLLKYNYVRSYDGGKKVDWSADELNLTGSSNN